MGINLDELRQTPDRIGELNLQSNWRSKLRAVLPSTHLSMIASMQAATRAPYWNGAIVGSWQQVASFFLSYFRPIRAAIPHDGYGKVAPIVSCSGAVGGGDWGSSLHLAKKTLWTPAEERRKRRKVVGLLKLAAGLAVMGMLVPPHCFRRTSYGYV
jgi:hypothetical protein